MTGLVARLPADVGARTELLDDVEALATRAVALDRARSGAGGATSLDWWMMLILSEHLDGVPVDFAGFATLRDSPALDRFDKIRAAAGARACAAGNTIDPRKEA